MRVAMISEHASPLACLGGTDAGGQNVYVDRLARHLAAAGWRVDVFTRRDDPDQPAEVALCPGARVLHVPAGPPRRVPKEELLPYMGAFAEWVVGVARRRRYALSHANFFMSALVSMEVRRRLGVPFAVTFHALGKVRRRHQGGADAFPAERERIEARAAAEAAAVIAECPQDADDLVTLYGADPGTMHTVPCGFDPAEFASTDQAAARRRIGVTGDEPVVLQLGRMVPRKGVDNVIRGVARVRRRGVPARLLVVGGETREPDPAATPEIGRLRRVAADEGVCEAVRFVGSRGRAELRDYYAAADVFVTTPWYEPFGITPVEAMACGTPVIGANVGGIKDTVRHGETGLLVPPKDPDALADALAAVLGDPARRAAMGRAARRRAVRHYTWATVADRVADVYRGVLAPVQRRAEPVAAVGS
jgi:glycosyltransferase involved in cell wall biosynthesis